MTPDRRGEVAPADSYLPGQRVWVYRGSWRPGVVIAASAQAVSVRYRPDVGRGTGVDTVLAADVVTREDADPMTDSPTTRSTGPDPARE
jgi:hypothetical protein